MIVAWPLGRRPRLRGWLHHLVASVAAGGSATVIYGVGAEPGRSMISFRPVSAAMDCLAAAVELVAAARVRPVPFFAGSALAAAEAELRGRDPVAAARAAWFGVPGRTAGERTGPIVSRFYPDLEFDPDRDAEVIEEFMHWTRVVAVPLLDHLAEGVTP